MKTILVDAWKTFIDENGVNSKMQEILDGYHNRKIIVTNANDEEVLKYGMVNLPYELYTLKHNPDKTDPEFFKRLFEHFNLSANDVVYFEHTPAAVESGRSLGITSYYYDSEKIDLEGLKVFLKENLE